MSTTSTPEDLIAQLATAERRMNIMADCIANLHTRLMAMEIESHFRNTPADPWDFLSLRYSNVSHDFRQRAYELALERMKLTTDVSA